MSIIEKIKKSRETRVDVGGFNFTVRRPTDLEVSYMRGQNLRQGDILERFVIGWDGVTELDVIPGGTGAPIAFETALFMEWVADRPDLWAPLADAVMQAYAAHRQKLDDSLGEASAG